MQKLTITAISLNKSNGDAFVLEGEDMYFYINSKRAEDPDISDPTYFDTIYPCPIAQVAGRFRHDWYMDNGEHDPVDEELVNRIEAQLKNPKFVEFCKRQKRLFGEKRLK